MSTNNGAQYRYKAVLFDLDGTLLDTILDLTEAVNYALKRYDQPTFTAEEVRSMVGRGIRNLMIDAVPGGESNPSFEEEFDVFLSYYMDHLYVYSSVYPGMMEVLLRLKECNIPVGIVSNKEEHAVGEIVSHFFRGYVTSYAGDNMIRPKKPARDIVDVVLRDIDKNLDARDVLYIGDSGVDADTASNAHLDCLLVSWGFRPREELVKLKCMAIIDSADEIYRYLGMG